MISASSARNVFVPASDFAASSVIDAPQSPQNALPGGFGMWQFGQGPGDEGQGDYGLVMLHAAQFIAPLRRKFYIVVP